MTIRLLKPNDQSALETFLAPHLESSIFLLNNSRKAGLIDRGEFLHGTYAATFEGDAITGVVAFYWNGRLVFQTPTLAHLPLLIETVMKAVDRPLKGFIGPAEQVASALDILGLTSANMQMDEEEGLFSLALDRLIIPPALQNGQVQGRPIIPADIDLITNWRTAYAIEALGATDSPELRAEVKRNITLAQERGDIWLLEEDGKPVACTGFNAAIAEAVQVGGVWTPPPYRSRGYARCAVAAHLLDARANGVKKGILFTGNENYPAQKAYIALGFERIGNYRLIII